MLAIILAGAAVVREREHSTVEYLLVMQASPSTHFVAIAQAILHRGAGFDIVWPRFLAVGLIGGVFLALGLWRFRKVSSQSG